MKKISLFLSAILLGVSLSACNTVKGFGQDVEKGGEKVQDAAQKTQNR